MGGGGTVHTKDLSGVTVSGVKSSSLKTQVFEVLKYQTVSQGGEDLIPLESSAPMKRSKISPLWVRANEPNPCSQSSKTYNFI